MEKAKLPKRRRDATATKASILAAAKRCFSELGYAAAGIRDVAALAGVSYTLLGRYYGSKAGLFEAALIDSSRIAPVIDTARSEFGEHLAGLIVQTLQDPQTTAMTILAAADPDARRIATRVVREHVVQPLADWIGEPYAQERALAITMLGGGFVIYSKHLPIVGHPFDQNSPIISWLSCTFQDILDNPDLWRKYGRVEGDWPNMFKEK